MESKSFFMKNTPRAIKMKLLMNFQMDKILLLEPKDSDALKFSSNQVKLVKKFPAIMN